jgi:hypothetical protein
MQPNFNPEYSGVGNPKEGEALTRVNEIDTATSGVAHVISQRSDYSQILKIAGEVVEG